MASTAPASAAVDQTTDSSAVSFLKTGLALVFAIAIIKFAIHVYAAKNYGYFVDELYFLACGEHLDWGYVDQPALIAVVAKLSRWLFGDGLRAIRFLPALAGAANVIMAGLIARELGGRRFAQAFAALCVAIAPANLSFAHYLSMNAFEPLFWMGCTLVVIRIVKTGDQKLWLWFGAIAGVGLHNKHSMLFFGFGVALGLLLTEHRRMFLKPWIWLGGLVALLIFLPNLIWNIQHDFPFLELMENIKRSGRNVVLTPWQFLLQQASLMLSEAAPVWIAGLAYLLFHQRGRAFRVLALTYLIVLATFLALHGRPYYLVPAYTMLFAAGAVWIESLLSHRYIELLKPAYILVVLVFGALAAPMSFPILPVDSYLRYVKARNIDVPRIENHELGLLPQFYADMYGWEEMVQVAARAYQSLDPELRSKTAIFGGNFGQAGAIDLFGSKYGLPRAIGNHQNYWYWGPREYTGESIIFLGASRRDLEPFCGSISEAGQVSHPFAMPYERFTVYHCRNTKPSLSEIWPKIKNWR